jgi:hypothetical protein
VPDSWFAPLVFASSCLLTLAGAGAIGMAEVPVLPVGGLGALLGGLALTPARAARAH